MVDVHRMILQKVIDCVRDNVGDARAIEETSTLEELSIDSMATITILVALEEEFGLDAARMLDAAPPRTLQELVTVAVQALPRGSPLLATANINEPIR
jgi:acyl carrier protein